MCFTERLTSFLNFRSPPLFYPPHLCKDLGFGCRACVEPQHMYTNVDPPRGWWRSAFGQIEVSSLFSAFHPLVRRPPLLHEKIMTMASGRESVPRRPPIQPPEIEADVCCVSKGLRRGKEAKEIWPAGHGEKSSDLAGGEVTFFKKSPRYRKRGPFQRS